MKRYTVFLPLLCLVIGLLLGSLLPVPWAEREVLVPSASSTPALKQAETGDSSGQSSPPLDAADNFPLLNAACSVVRALERQDYAALAGFVHPERGVAFTPYSTVNAETDQSFTAAQIRDLSRDSTTYIWGFVDGRGSLIELTMQDYFTRYVWDADYTQAPQIGIDRLMMSGNALENLPEAYPGCRFVDFCFPGRDPSSQGLDWCSLRLVFAPGETSWYLVGIVHGEWTI